MNSSAFSIKSSTSDKSLVFSAPRKDYFTAELTGSEVQATRKVYAYSPHSPSVGQLFARLAKRERPWEGAESWQSLEGEFSLSVTCSNTGSVSFSLAMLGRQDSPERWRVAATLTMDLGQLISLAAAAEQFFGVVGGT